MLWDFYMILIFIKTTSSSVRLKANPEEENNFPWERWKVERKGYMAGRSKLRLGVTATLHFPLCTLHRSHSLTATLHRVCNHFALCTHLHFALLCKALSTVYILLMRIPYRTHSAVMMQCIPTCSCTTASLALHW